MAPQSPRQPAERSWPENIVAQRELALFEEAASVTERYSAPELEGDLAPIHARAVNHRLDALYARLVAVEELERELMRASARSRNAPSDLPAPAARDGKRLDHVVPLLELPACEDLDKGPRTRRHRRVETMVTALLAHDSSIARGVVLNVSPFGAFIASSEPLEAGSTLKVSFSLSLERRISGRSVVRWVRPWHELQPDVLPGIGIEFLATSTGATEELTAFVREQLAAASAVPSQCPT